MKAGPGRLYERVAAQLAGKITSGEYRIGQRLPSERELAQLFDVSRPTIREAVIALEIDGLVEVRMSSGVYAIAREPKGGVRGVIGAGPFEVLEARRSFEAEACAIAATRITDDDILELELLCREISDLRDYEAAEDADRRFHLKIAACTGNSMIGEVVGLLWDARLRSPQYQLLAQKAHEAGIGPDIDEHKAILDALKSRDSSAARNAMRSHLSRVIETLLAVTEVQELEQVRERTQIQRKRLAGAV